MTSNPIPASPIIVEHSFDDIDAMAASPLHWDQQYEQLGRGSFKGKLTQALISNVQLGRTYWSPGILHKGAAPKGTWVFGLPLKAEGSLHVRRRPVQAGELMAATSRDDIGFAATGPTDLMVAVLPNEIISRWLRARRGVNGISPDLPPRHWAISAAEMACRSTALLHLLSDMRDQAQIREDNFPSSYIESKISDIILDIIPSAEVVEGLHARARIARMVLQLLYDRREEPPSITEICELVGARERTLYLSCIEAFGRPPAQLLLELRLNAAQRALLRPQEKTSVSMIAAQFGFINFGRFSALYFRQFGELPSATLAKGFRV